MIGPGSGAALAPASTVPANWTTGGVALIGTAMSRRLFTVEASAAVPGGAASATGSRGRPGSGGPAPEMMSWFCWSASGAVVAILCSVKDRMLEAHADGGWIKKSRLCRAEDSQLKLNRPTSIGCTILLGEGLNFWCAQGKYLM